MKTEPQFLREVMELFEADMMFNKDPRYYGVYSKVSHRYKGLTISPDEWPVNVMREMMEDPTPLDEAMGEEQKVGLDRKGDT